MDLEVLATGFGLVEAPRVDEHDRLYFSDVFHGGIHRRSRDGKIEAVVPGRKYVGGMAFNDGGGLVFCGKGGIAAWDEKTNRIRDIITYHEGQPLQFNDMTVDDHGSIWAGTFGYDVFAHPRPDPAPGALFRIDPPGTMVLMWDKIELTNGLGFSPDRKLLYHSDSATDTVWVYDVTPDRRLKDRRPFVKLPNGTPDGLTVDIEGGLWVAAAMGSEVVHFRADGRLDHQVKVPLLMPSSVVLGGADMRDLYIVTGDERYFGEEPVEPPPRATIYRMRSPVAGLKVPKAKF
jgi:sugar lactone lactonase YvrE